MKKIIFAALAVICSVAFAEYQFVDVRGAARGISGEIVAFDVQSTNGSQTATLKRVRDIVSYTNALDISSYVVTNRVYFPETIVTNGMTNVVQGVSNVVMTIMTTNGYRKVVGARQCVTNSVSTVECTNGFATVANFSEWILKEDAIVIECTDSAAKTTVVIKK